MIISLFCIITVWYIETKEGGILCMLLSLSWSFHCRTDVAHCLVRTLNVENYPLGQLCEDDMSALGTAICEFDLV